jgi:hypothetical protein
MGRNRRAKVVIDVPKPARGVAVPSLGMIGAAVDSGHAEKCSGGVTHDDDDLDVWYKLQSTQQKEEYFKEGLLVYAPYHELGKDLGKSLIDGLFHTSN